MTARRPTAGRTVLLAGAALALTACTLSACTAAPGPTASTPPPARASPAPASTAPATPTAVASPSPSGASGAGPSASAVAVATQRYVGFVQQFSPGLAALDPEVLVALGQQVCTGFEQGREPGEISVALGEDDRAPDLEATDAAVIIGAAVATLCPQYDDDLQQ